MPVTLMEQVDCARRELVLRQRVYPRWVQDGRLKEAKAEEEITRMEAIIGTLLGLLESQVVPALNGAWHVATEEIPVPEVEVVAFGVEGNIYRTRIAWDGPRWGWSYWDRDAGIDEEITHWRAFEEPPRRLAG